MTTIDKKRNIITVINIFSVEKSNQQKLVAMLEDAVRLIMTKHVGFISANIHKSVDGTMVLNYTQWENREDFEKMLTNPRVI